MLGYHCWWLESWLASATVIVSRIPLSLACSLCSVARTLQLKHMQSTRILSSLPENLVCCILGSKQNTWSLSLILKGDSTVWKENNPCGTYTGASQSVDSSAGREQLTRVQGSQFITHAHIRITLPKSRAQYKERKHWLVNRIWNKRNNEAERHMLVHQ